MKPKIIECPKCESRFDVSAFEPGSKFECVACKNVIVVPAEVSEIAKPTAPRRRRPEGWGKSSRTGPVSVPGGRSRPAPRRGDGGVPSPAPTGRRAGGVPTPAPTGRKTGGVPEPRPSVPGRAGPAGRAADTRRAAAVEAVSSRQERPSRHRSHEGDGGGGSNLPLLLGLAGLAVAVVVVIFIAMSSGDGGGETGPGPEVALGPRTRPSTTDDVNSDQWSDAKRRQYWANNLKLKPIGQSRAQAVKTWRANHAWAERHGMLDLAREALTALLEVDSQDRWANEKLGNKLFVYAYGTEKGSAFEEIPWERKKEISDFVEEHGTDGKVWVSLAKHGELTALQALEKKHVDRIASDPRYRWTTHWILATRRDPGYSEYAFEVNEEYPPYLVFVQDPGREVDRADVDRVVRRNGLILQTLHRGWEEIIEPEIRKVAGYERFELPRLGEVTGDDYHLLKIWVFPTEKDLRAHHDKIGQPAPEGARVHYSPLNQWITLCERRSGESEWWDKQNSRIGKVFNEGTRQILHFYTKIVMDRQYAKMGEDPTDYEDISSKSYWFTEGVPELFAGADEIVKDEKWEVFQPNHRRIAEYRRALRSQNKEQGYYWTLNDLVKISGDAALARAAREKSLNPKVHEMLYSLFYAEAWTFCHFLWNGVGGKYRKLLVRYLIEELEGNSGLNVFQGVMKGVAPNGDFTALERKMIEYLGTMPTVRPRRR